MTASSFFASHRAFVAVGMSLAVNKEPGSSYRCEARIEIATRLVGGFQMSR
jgi:hypothetical protein